MGGRRTWQRCEGLRGIAVGGKVLAGVLECFSGCRTGQTRAGARPVWVRIQATAGQRGRRTQRWRCAGRCSGGAPRCGGLVAAAPLPPFLCCILHLSRRRSVALFTCSQSVSPAACCGHAALRLTAGRGLASDLRAGKRVRSLILTPLPFDKHARIPGRNVAAAARPPL